MFFLFDINISGSVWAKFEVEVLVLYKAPGLLCFPCLHGSGLGPVPVSVSVCD